MRTSLALAAPVFAIAASLAVTSCARPEPPRLTPRQAVVTTVDATGMNLDLQIDAYNPNRFDLSARSVTATIVVDQRLSLGPVTIPSGVTLPAQQTTTLAVPAQVKWVDVTSLALFALAGRPVPFRVDGTATIGGERLNVDLPLHLDGTITPEQLRAAAIRSVPARPATP